MSIAKALAAAQAEMKNPPMDASNPHFRSRFASLKAVVEAAKAPLNKHGIAVVQELLEADGGVNIKTYLIHESGTLAYGPAFFPANKRDAQAYASASTYARRITLATALALVGDEDDDGNAATDAAAHPITEKQAADILALIEDVGADKARFLNHLKIDAVSALPASRYEEAIRKLEAKRRAA